MNGASVGFHCPECVAAANARQRSVTTALGGRVPSKPSVTYALIAINAGIYLLGFVLPGTNTSSMAVEFGMIPGAIALGEWWRLITSTFLHGGLLHVLFNMYVLYLLGPALERLLGHGRYLLMYLLAAFGGSVASYLFSPINVASVGASGAIFGLMGAILVVGRRFRHDVSQVALLLAINVVIGFVVPGIDWRAHFGGALTGAAAAAVLAYAPRTNRLLWQSLGLLAIFGVLIGLTMLRTAAITDDLLVIPGVNATEIACESVVPESEEPCYPWVT